MEGIDPFINCVTLASLCHLVFRRNFMKSKSIALINDNGLGPRQCYSEKQMLWLKLISRDENISIRHCFNNKEFKIGQFHVDGYCQETRTAYDFKGCFFQDLYGKHIQ
jgi:hypothetical protein